MKKTIIQFSALFFLTILSSCGLDMLNRIEGNNNEFLGGRGVKTHRKIAREQITPEDEKLI